MASSSLASGPALTASLHGTEKLFTPVTIGPLVLSHRVVMAPLTRSRAQQPGDIPGDLMVEYYRQRASRGGLIISEATTISASARGWYGAPGIYTEAQVAGWQNVTASVHAEGGFIFSQLWHTGRSGHSDLTGLPPVAPSVVRSKVPSPLRTAGRPHRHTGLSKWQRSHSSWRIIATLPNMQRRPASMELNCMQPMGTWLMSFYRMAATNARMLTAAP